MYGEVLRTQQLTPSLVRVVLGGPGLAGFEAPTDPDAYVNVAIPPPGAAYGPVFDPDEVKETLARDWWPARRRYTVRGWADGELTLDFVVHGDSGAAGPWARDAQPGDVLVLTGPGSGYSPDPDADWHLLVGDESALPAIARTLEVLPAGAVAVVRLVVDGPAHELDLESGAETDVVWLHRSGDEPSPLPAAVEAIDFPAGRVHAFVHGEADEIRTIRRHLLADRGLTRGQMSCSPYWRRTMTDEAWRAIKRDFVAQMDADA